MRDLQNYRSQASSEKRIVTGGSACNIKAESLRLGDFTQPQVKTLLREHMRGAGQILTAEVLRLVWKLTQGQPWLVNTLAYATTWRNPAGRDRTKPITAKDIQAAKVGLIQRRVTRFDQLAEKLRVARVRHVVKAILVGSQHQSSGSNASPTARLALELLMQAFLQRIINGGGR